MVEKLEPHVKEALDAAYGDTRPAPGSIILRYKQRYGLDHDQHHFEIAILDREDIPVMDITSQMWVLGIANEELFTEESYIQKLLAPSHVSFMLYPHARTGNRRHGYWQAEPTVVVTRRTPAGSPAADSLP